MPAAALLQPAKCWCQLLNHPATDGLDLALAERQNAVLLTRDRRLLRKLESVPQAKAMARPLELWQAGL